VEAIGVVVLLAADESVLFIGTMLYMVEFDVTAVAQAVATSSQIIPDISNGLCCWTVWKGAFDG